MAYLFNTPEQQQEMLREIGVGSIDELLGQVPENVRLERPLDLPPPLTEPELECHVRQLAGQNITDRVCFQGGGAYDHFIPAVVDEIAGRGEFYTAYTPYQPEASQGSLQAFFEYQSMICQLTGLDVSNASLYEGGTAVSEAAFMAIRVTGRRRKVAVAETVHPEYRQVLETYFRNIETEVVTLPMVQGNVDLDRAAELVDGQTSCLIFQHPNFFGCLEDAQELCAIARRAKALSVVSFDPMSLGILKRPGDHGADIGVAEGQPLGIPLQYGGPYLGILACRNEYVRKMPGRLISMAQDRDGRDCHVLGLQTREQHIRRDKATSNICTNQGLLALRATVFMATLGPEGFREAANLCCQKSHYAHQRLSQVPGLAPLFERPFFKEFGLRVVEGNAADYVQRAADAGFEIGPSLDRFSFVPESLRNCLLIAVTESRTREEIDRLADALGA